MVLPEFGRIRKKGQDCHVENVFGLLVCSVDWIEFGFAVAGGFFQSGNSEDRNKKVPERPFFRISSIIIFFRSEFLREKKENILSRFRWISRR